MWIARLFSLDAYRNMPILLYGKIKTCIESIENEYHNKKFQKKTFKTSLKL